MTAKQHAATTGDERNVKGHTSQDEVRMLTGRTSQSAGIKDPRLNGEAQEDALPRPAL